MASFATVPLSPEETASLQELSELHVQKLIKNTADPLRNCDGHVWTLNFSKEEIKLKVYSSVAADVKLLRFKGVCTLPYDTKTIVDFVGDNSHRMTWDRNVCDINTHDIYSSDDGSSMVKLLRVATKKVGPISGRDFADIIAIQKIDNGRFVNAGASISAKDMTFIDNFFPESKAFVRGWNHSGGGWMFEPLETIDGSPTTQISYGTYTLLQYNLIILFE